MEFTTHGRTLTETDIVMFSGISGDYFYLHTDEMASKKTVFNGRIAHGYLILAIISGLISLPRQGSVVVNYGIDRLRFLKPVVPGNTLRAKMRCVGTEQKARRKGLPSGGVVTWEVTALNEENAEVMSMNMLTYVSDEFASGCNAGSSD
nr:MaoC/PaaZ C-terminal domain-containing protein [Acetobacter persici]